MRILPIVVSAEEAATLRNSTRRTQTLRSPWFRDIKVGDRLWVKEPWGKVGDKIAFDLRDSGVNASERLGGKEYRRQNVEDLPREASRLTLDVIAVRHDGTYTEITFSVHKRNVDEPSA